MYRWNNAKTTTGYITTPFQYYKCIGGIFHDTKENKTKEGFNTTNVSVEFLYIKCIRKYLSMFQYYKCIGGINVEMRSIPTPPPFQYYKCIGGIKRK